MRVTPEGGGPGRAGPGLVVEGAAGVLRVCPSVVPFGRVLDRLGDGPGYAGRPAPALPLRAACAWTALEVAGRSLNAADAAVWESGLRRLRSACDRLGARYHSASAMEVAESVAAAEAEIHRMWEWAGVPGRPEGDLLVFSVRLPWRVYWCDELREGTRRAIGLLLARHGRDGTAERERVRLLGRLADGAPSTAGRARGPGPWGSVLVRPTVAGAVWLGGGLPHLMPFAGLHHALLAEAAEGSGPAHPDPPPSAAAWLRRALPDGVEAIEVVGRDAANPDAALHPPLTDEVADPRDLGGEGPAGLTVTVDGGLRPWLGRAGEAAWRVPVYGSCAVIGRGDPRGRLLLALAGAQGWDLTRRHEPVPARVRLADDTCAVVYPRVTCADGTVTAPKRWRIEAGPFVVGSAAERYLAWRRTLDELGVPDLVYVRIALGAPELLVRTDSPLVLRTLLDRLPADTPCLELTETPGPPEEWPIVDQAGRHYAAELAVDWIHPRHRSEPPPRRPASHRALPQPQAPQPAPVARGRREQDGQGAGEPEEGGVGRGE
ncbi:hypothetical protein [Embleya scabrispora]|uniref:hypothetical protein n=1 Tax=Embleya scabrispora TaxID=159449 RepID=UPI001374D53C|nr:hypothetical protein [Embleya scabrispora]